MKKVLVVLLLLAVVVVAIFAWLTLSSPSEGRSVRFSEWGGSKRLLAMVPAEAEEVALVPSASGVYREMQKNKVTAKLLVEWGAGDLGMLPTLLGGADLVAWRVEDQTVIAAIPDPFRLRLARLFLGMTGRDDVKVVGDALVLGGSPADAASIEVPAKLQDASGEAFLITTDRSDSDFPPLPHPTFTSLVLSPEKVNLVSTTGAAGVVRTDGRKLHPHAASAAVSAAYIDEAPGVRELTRVLPAPVVDLASQGATVAIYGVDGSGLLPRFRGVVIVPGGEAEEAQLNRNFEGFFTRLGGAGTPVRESYAGTTIVQRKGVAFTLRYARRGGDLIVGLDDEGLREYLNDKSTPEVPSGDWSIRVVPATAIPMLDALKDLPALRLAAPRFRKSVRDLHSIVKNLADADAVTLSRTGNVVTTVLE